MADQLPVTQPPAHFTHGSLAAAIRYIQSLPRGTRVYVEEWVDNAWRFVYGDLCEYMLPGLRHLTPGARFRICHESSVLRRGPVSNT